jgi:ribosome-associated protein
MLRIREEEIEWQFSRSGGPGGQNVNKVSSKATLRWAPKQHGLSPEMLQRLTVLGHHWVTAEGELLISSQRHRQQLMNMEDCRDKLRALLRAAAYRPKYRKKTNPTKGSKERRLQDKRQRSERKERRKRLED